MKNIVIVGSSGHAKVVIDIVERASRYRIVGLIDSFSAVGSETLGYKILGNELALPNIIKTQQVAGMLIAVGDNYARCDLRNRIASIAPHLPLVSAIHPQAAIARSAQIGAGTVVMAGAVVNADSVIGESCIVNTKASLDHDGKMAPYSSLAPGVVTGGNCRLGNISAVGIGAILKQGITIGEHSVIGAGAVVLQDVEPYVVAYGNPAKKVHSRKAGAPYL
ncbi:acetyltransferase [Paraburkholderia tagetis]|uniref:Acetyltransferase n=1 Tax=Paraburkholderia tagetis TaxID=2913261 RepID=A0A9X1ZZB7_9BURK|nr:acetyltransferase [Paraburkholderia tagetis]MCG5078782.1 acetyltransferase [Paraburkholderia tagetis]